ncbi:pyridoxal phosphate-dependent aminotransferase [Saccharopolyspora erythraea]|uniref:pyridoxal phosphate-dependent aminotransferase n=1 Tax=Saccharopolyspora erythraea TaxID=1836 RepID=UPI001BAD851C|nr:pyridoxal phosphate-dependent aminotransferase [Saccharopolyspora erythraea]QUH02358.1 pyridoxal phosphate-dependent aminotransferase [Saccharopolyspora erythraea]
MPDSAKTSTPAVSWQQFVDGFPDAEQRLVLGRDLAEHESRPQKTNLAVAENVTIYPLLERYVFGDLAGLSEDGLRYVTPYGSPRLRELMAERLEKSLAPKWPVPEVLVRPDDVFGTAGVSSALECVALALRGSGFLQAGDGVLIPAPCWQGFKWSFEQRPQLRCVYAHAGVPGDPDPVKRFELSLRNLEDTYATADPAPKLLVLTNPHNPLGVNYRKDLLEEIFAWALGKGMHVISDEMYRHSQLAGSEPEFVSALALDAVRSEAARERVHVVWGLAKDFGLSGFRAGFIVSRSPAVRAAMKGGEQPKVASLSWFSPFDSLKHRVALRLLEARVDGLPFWDVAMRSYSERLTAQFTAVEDALADWDIACVHGENANCAQFLWVDLTRWLGTVDTAASDGAGMFPGAGRSEAALAAYLADAADVVLLPGRTLSCRDEGYFRLCFTAYRQEVVVDAANRIGEALHRLSG